MSDFFIYLEEIGAIESTEWAFDNLSSTEMDDLFDQHIDGYKAMLRDNGVKTATP